MKLLTILFCLCLGSISYAQDIDYNWIIPPLDKPGISFEEKLVAIAWKNYPQNKVLQHELQSAMAKVEIADKSWAQGWNFNSQVSVGSNPDTLGAPNPNTGLRTGVGVGVSLNLGALYQRKAKVKAASEEAKIVEEQLNLQKLAIRSEVLKRYQDYKLATDLLRLRTQGLDDIYSGYLSIRNLYEQGEVSLQEYNQVLTVYNTAQESKIESENQVVSARRALEELIGLGLGDVQ